MNNKPFENPYRDATLVKNVVLDHIMPALSPSGWKVLCVAIRLTWGKADQASPQGHLEAARISVSEFLEKTGLGDADTITKAIDECLDAGYLVRHQIGQDAQAGRHRFVYSLNTTLEFPEAPAEEDATAFQSPESEAAFQALVDFGHEMEAEPDLALARDAVLRNDADAVMVWIETGREMTHLEKPTRYKTVVQRLLDKVPPLPTGVFAPDFGDDVTYETEKPTPSEPVTLTAHELWQATLESLKPQLKKSKFRWLLPTQAIELSLDTLTIEVPNKRTKDWLEEGQLATVIQETVESVAGEALTLVYVVAERGH